MEQHVLSSINWVVGHPTSESWLRLACVTKTGLVEEKLTQNCARFLMEITLFYKEFLVYKSSELAVAALVLARFILGKSRRVSRLVHFCVVFSQRVEFFFSLLILLFFSFLR